MREILFRGKRSDNENWICGSFHKRLNETFIIPLPIITSQSKVIPETVGQYTGLTDKNGKKIFEGDIVEGHCHSRWRHDLQRCEVAYGRDGFEARHHVKSGEEHFYYTYKVLFSKDVVVIGNIHDNPELLQEAN